MGISGLPQVPILNDAHLLGGALLTHHCAWGVAVIAGTGSIVVSLEVGLDGAVDQTGRRGGFGYLLGDDGSCECLDFSFHPYFLASSTLRCLAIARAPQMGGLSSLYVVRDLCSSLP